jgi:hypothetical protein
VLAEGVGGRVAVLKQRLRRLDANMRELQSIFEDDSIEAAPVARAA